MCTQIALTEPREIYTIVPDNPSPPRSSNWNHSTQLAYGFIYHMFEISFLHPSSSKGDQRQLSWLPTVFPHCYFWTPVTPAWSSPVLLWQVSLVATSERRLPFSLQTTYTFFRIGRERSKQILYMHSADPLHSFFCDLLLPMTFTLHSFTSTPPSISKLTSLLSISWGRNFSTEFCYSWNPPQILGTMLEERLGEIEKSSEKGNGDDQRTEIYILWKYKIRTNGRNIKDADRD